MEGKGEKFKELDFGLWQCGKHGGGSLNKEESLNKEVDFESWHCGRQGGEV